MGSYGNAVMTGFICRLCSEQKKCVIHLYSRKGEEMNLMKKIALLPIKVNNFKTNHLDKFYNLLMPFIVLGREVRSFAKNNMRILHRKSEHAI